MKRAVIFGVTDFAEWLYYHLRRDDAAPAIDAFAVDREYLREQAFNGLPVVAAETLSKDYPPTTHEVFVCVGYAKMNAARERIHCRLKAEGYAIGSYIHPDARIYAKKTGEGLIAMPGATVDAGCVLGAGNVLYIGATISHHCQAGDFNFFAVRSCLAGHVRVGNRCFIGAHATVRDGVSLADEVLVGAHTYVAHDIHRSCVISSGRGIVTDKDPKECL